PTLLLFALARIGAGAGRAFDPAHTSLLADYYPPEERARVYSYRQFAVVAGGLLGPVIAGFVAGFLPWQTVFVVVGARALVLAWFALRMREPVRGEQERRVQGATEDDALTAERAPSIGESFRIVWNVRTLRRILYALPFLIGPGLGIVTLTSLYYDR